MKAVYIQQFGGLEVLKYCDLPNPSAEPGKIVVDTFAASINGADWKVPEVRAVCIKVHVNRCVVEPALLPRHRHLLSPYPV